MSINNPQHLYHVTWKSYLDDILMQGLIPNHRPNNWHSPKIIANSKLGVFLCIETYIICWMRSFCGTKGYAQRDDHVACLMVDCLDLELYADNLVGSSARYCPHTIPPHRLTVLDLDRELFSYSHVISLDTSATHKSALKDAIAKAKALSPTAAST